MKASLGVWTAFYCDNRYSDCVRYQATQQGKAVPDLMLPNGKILRVSGERT